MRTGLVTHLAYNELDSILIFDHILIIWQRGAGTDKALLPLTLHLHLITELKNMFVQ